MGNGEILQKVQYVSVELTAYLYLILDADLQAFKADKALTMHVSDWNNSVGSNMRKYTPKYHKYNIKTKRTNNIDTTQTPGALLDILIKYNYIQRGHQRVNSEEVCLPG